MALPIKKYWSVLKTAGTEFAADNVMKLSASLAYYTVFSLGPLMLVIVSLLGLFFEEKSLMWKVYWQLKDMIGQASADQIINIIENMQDRHAGSFSIIGFAVLIFGTTTVFADMQSSINYIWSIKAKPERGWLKFLKNRLLSFSMVISIAFLLLVSLVISSLTDLLTDKLFASIKDDYVIIFKIINLLILFIIVTIMFMMVYKILPDAEIKWRDTLVGSVFTGVLFILGKYLIGLYISSSEMDNTYGAAASVVIILAWVYYTSTILYFGAEFTKAYAMELGGKIMHSDHAVFIIKKEAQELPEGEVDAKETATQKCDEQNEEKQT